MEPRSDVRLTRTKPRFVRGVVIGDTDLTATELTNIKADIIDLQAAAALEITEKPNPLAVTVPDNTPYVNVSITADDGTIELTLPTGASNVGRLLALSVDISGSTTLDVHTGMAVETSIPNGSYLYYCIWEGIWVGLHAIYAAYVAET